MKSDIEKIIDEYVSAWNQLDFQSLRALWKNDETDIYYVAEEIDRPFYTLDQVINYWEKTAAVVEQLTMTTADRRVKLLSDELGVVMYAMHMDATLRSAANTPLPRIGVDVRVSAILRKAEAGWRLIHYAEAPLGALPFVRRAYQANVRD